MAGWKKYPGHIEQRSAGSFRVTLCVGAKTHKFGVKGTRLDAENFAVAKHATLVEDAKRVGLGLPGPTRMSNLLAGFEATFPTLAQGTQDSYQQTVDQARVFFVEQHGDPFCRDVSRALGAAFLDWVRTANPKRPVSAYTVQRHRRVMQRIFNFGIERELLDVNPMKYVKAPKADPRTPPILTEAELTRLTTACDDMLGLIVHMGAATGMRVGEMTRLTWDDPDLTLPHPSILIRSTPEHRTKSGKSRRIPITRALRDALAEHAAKYRFALASPYLFAHPVTTRTAKRGEQIRSFNGAFRRAVARAGLPKHLRMHDLRHRFVTMQLAAGRPVAAVSAYVGHSSILVTQQYLHLVPEHLRAVVEPLDAPAPTPEQPPATSANG